MNMNAFDLSHSEIVDLIARVGTTTTVLVEGHIGSGKTSIGKMLAERFPDHELCYFDSTTKDMGDLFLPNMQDAQGGQCVRFVPNEEFGIHTGKPVILMIDEFGKANPMVQQALLRTALERCVGNTPLVEGSIVFMTTNLGRENVGDILKAHANDRLIRVRMRKPSQEGWLEWAIDNGMNASVMRWAQENEMLFQSFEEVSANDNPYIFHPDEKRSAFVTQRGLEMASNIVDNIDTLGKKIVHAALIGTIGARGASDLMAFVSLLDDMPSVQSIKDDPHNAVVPKSSAAVCMVVFRALATIEREWTTAWLTYMKRLNIEAQAMFVNGIRMNTTSEKGNERRQAVMTNKAFAEWAMENAHLYASDKV